MPTEVDQWRETVAERCDLPMAALAYLDDPEEIRAVARYLVRVRAWEAERRFWWQVTLVMLSSGAINGFLAWRGLWLLVPVGLAAAVAVGARFALVAARAHRGRWWLERAQPYRVGPDSGEGECKALGPADRPSPDWRINAPGPSRPGPGPDVPLNRPDDLWQAWGDALKVAEAARDADAANPSTESLRRWQRAMERVNVARDAYREAERSVGKGRIA